MLDFITKMIDNGNLIDIISCVFTVAALIFTLYFWMLDHLSEEESEFIKSKSGILDTLTDKLVKIKELRSIQPDDEEDTKTLLAAIADVNKQMEVILSYRFWARGKQKDAYLKVNDFYRDSKYAVSTIRRSLDNKENDIADERSLVSIQPLCKEELDDIISDYQKGLSFTIEFIENWE